MEYNNFPWYVNEILRLAAAGGEPLGNIKWIVLNYMALAINQQLEPAQALANIRAGNYPKIPVAHN